MTPVVARPRSKRDSIEPPVSAGDEGGGGGGSEWVVLTRARDDIDAHLLAGRLAELNIDVRTIKDRSAPGAWLHGGSNPWAPVTVLVRRRNFDDARFVLIALAEAGDAGDPDASPEDGAPAERRPLVWVTALLLGLTLGAIALSQPLRSATVCHIPGFCADR